MGLGNFCQKLICKVLIAKGEKMVPVLDSFTKGYIEAALWSSNDDDGGPFDGIFTVEDLADETLVKIIADCAKFQADNADHIMDENCLRGRSQYGTDAIAGHDFWLTRNRYGAGFWDGDWREPAATLLTIAAHDFGGCDLYVSDDGKLYL